MNAGKKRMKHWPAKKRRKAFLPGFAIHKTRAPLRTRPLQGTLKKTILGRTVVQKTPPFPLHRLVFMPETLPPPCFLTRAAATINGVERPRADPPNKTPVVTTFNAIELSRPSCRKLAGPLTSPQKCKNGGASATQPRPTPKES